MIVNKLQPRDECTCCSSSVGIVCGWGKNWGNQVAGSRAVSMWEGYARAWEAPRKMLIFYLQSKMSRARAIKQT